MRSIEIPVPALAEKRGATINLRKIFGSNLFDAGDWVRWYGIPRERFAATPPFPWRVEMLRAPCPFFSRRKVWQTHFAFLGIESVGGRSLNLSLFEEMHPRAKRPHFDSGETPWYGQETFTWATLSLRWYVLSKSVVPRSLGLVLSEQMALLPPRYELPLALAEAMKNIFFYRKHFLHRHLNHDCWARCADRTQDGALVEIGNFDKTGLSIGHSMPGSAGPDVGIGASLKLPR